MLIDFAAGVRDRRVDEQIRTVQPVKRCCSHCRRPHHRPSTRSGEAVYCKTCEAARLANLQRYADRYENGEPIFGVETPASI